jgi:hypothetical protein
MAGCVRASYERPPYRGPAPSRCYTLAYHGDGADAFPAWIGLVDDGRTVVGRPAPRGERYWRMLGPAGTVRQAREDSAEVSFGNGFSSIELVLRASGDSIAGQAWFASDVIGPTPPPRTPVTGLRATCGPADRG